MNDKILITTDSTTDLGDELLKRHDIKILPLGVSLGDALYKDGIDITPEDIYSNYKKNKTLPKTSAINVTEADKFFKEYTEKGYTVIHFTISSDMSATYHNCRLGAEKYPGVYVVDTRNLSSGGGQVALLAAEMAEQGSPAEQILEACESITPRIDASFVIDDLEFLAKGGRCSTVAAIGANLLKLKPCIIVKDGVMSVGKKNRGNYEMVLKQYIMERLGDCQHIVPNHVFITHAGIDPMIVNHCVELVEGMNYFHEIHVTTASCTISSHCGRNTLGVLFTRK